MVFNKILPARIAEWINFVNTRYRMPLFQTRQQVFGIGHDARCLDSRTGCGLGFSFHCSTTPSCFNLSAAWSSRPMSTWQGRDNQTRSCSMQLSARGKATMPVCFHRFTSKTSFDCQIRKQSHLSKTGKRIPYAEHRFNIAVFQGTKIAAQSSVSAGDRH